MYANQMCSSRRPEDLLDLVNRRQEESSLGDKLDDAIGAMEPFVSIYARYCRMRIYLPAPE
jgi:hypothetical protein